MPSWLKTWPHGRTWVFQGTVAEDATGGTHVCTLTVTPGAGNEMEVLYGQIFTGNTATSQIPFGRIDDAAASGNQITQFLNPESVGLTTASVRIPFGQVTAQAPAALIADINFGSKLGLLVSGTMALIIGVSTAAISVTQTFSVACRIMGALPTATLADTVGTPVLTTNTNQVF